MATDLAARGLDIPDLTYVINFDIPRNVNTYLHRAGRTGRMNKEGFVVSLGDDHDFRDLKKLLADEVEIKRAYFAGYHLSTHKPKKKNKKDKIVEQSKPKAKHKKKKRNNKNKGYHPHYLKVNK